MISHSCERQVSSLRGPVSWERGNGLALPPSAKHWFETSVLVFASYSMVCRLLNLPPSTTLCFHNIFLKACVFVWLCNSVHSLMLNYGAFKEMSEDLIPFVFEWKRREYGLVGWVCKDKRFSGYLTCWLTSCLLWELQHRARTFVAPERLQAAHHFSISTL